MIIAFVQSELTKSFISFLGINQIKYTESEGFFYIKPESKIIKKNLNKFFAKKNIKKN